MQTIVDKAQVDELLSQTTPVVFFKHSSTCGTSTWAYDLMATALAEDALPKEAVYMIVVQDARDVSDYIAEKLGITHESPQVIVVKDGTAVYDESHRAITIDAIKEVL